MPTAFGALSATLGTFIRAGVLTGLRPDKYLRMAAATRGGGSVTVGFAIAARRCPDRAGLIDELGTLTWKQLRADALASGLTELSVRTIGILCRNHRGFVTTLMAADRLGVDVLLLNTSFAGPALAAVVSREDVDVIVYDDEFGDIVDRALADRPATTRVRAWADECEPVPPKGPRQSGTPIAAECGPGVDAIREMTSSSSRRPPGAGTTTRLRW